MPFHSFELEIIAIRTHFNGVLEIGLIDGHGSIKCLTIEIAAELIGAAQVKACGREYSVDHIPQIVVGPSAG
jgi:hypothetical protein